MLSIDEQLQLLRRRCERILTEEELRAKLRRSTEAGKPLRVKLGLDPTAADVTLGNAVPLKVVRQFQDWGHLAVLIIGDYTARVGDPTGRNELRPQLSDEDIDHNARRFVAQLGKVLLTDAAHLEVRHNGEWLAGMTTSQVIKLLSRKTVAQLLARDDFHKRYTSNIDIHLHELMYPLLQGWDSVMINADIELGGSDQLFNNLVGRELQCDLGKDAQVVIVTPLLVGTDGHVKMSKSKGNAISVTDPPSGDGGMFGKVMSLPDTLLDSYWTLLTDEPRERFEPTIRDHPRDAKVALAKHVIAWLHSPEDAERAEAEFNRIFREHGEPDDMPEFAVGPEPQKLAPLIVKAGLARSNSEAIQKIKEGAVTLGGERITDFQKPYAIESPVVLKLGRRFARLKP